MGGRWGKSRYQVAGGRWRKGRGCQGHSKPLALVIGKPAESDSPLRALDVKPSPEEVAALTPPRVANCHEQDTELRQNPACSFSTCASTMGIVLSCRSKKGDA